MAPNKPQIVFADPYKPVIDTWGVVFKMSGFDVVTHGLDGDLDAIIDVIKGGRHVVTEVLGPRGTRIWEDGVRLLEAGLASGRKLVVTSTSMDDLRGRVSDDLLRNIVFVEKGEPPMKIVAAVREAVENV